MLFRSLPYPQYVREVWARPVADTDLPQGLVAWAQMPLLPGTLGRHEPSALAEPPVVPEPAPATGPLPPSKPLRPLMDRTARMPGRGHSVLVWLRHHGVNGAAGG